jgi:hypothetical protein
LQNIAKNLRPHTPHKQGANTEGTRVALCFSKARREWNAEKSLFKVAGQQREKAVL